MELQENLQAIEATGTELWVISPDESEAETTARLERSRSYQQLQHWRERLTVTSVETSQ